jgi:tRNA (cmo5U34)-methyltransferase
VGGTEYERAVNAPATATAAQAFSAHAAQYTALRRRLVPGYDAFYGAVIDSLALVRGGMRRVLDLGAGTGLLSAHVREAFPDARIELLDGSEPMLREARERLGPGVAAVHVRDMADPLPDGPFDAIVSALAIHHLEDEAKRELMRRAHDALRPGGAFINAEQVSAPTPALDAVYEHRWAQDCRALAPHSTSSTRRVSACATTAARTPRPSCAGCATRGLPPPTASTSPGGSRSCSD